MRTMKQALGFADRQLVVNPPPRGIKVPRWRIIDGHDHVVRTKVVWEVLKAPRSYAEKRHKKKAMALLVRAPCRAVTGDLARGPRRWRSGPVRPSTPLS